MSKNLRGGPSGPPDDARRAWLRAAAAAGGAALLPLGRDASAAHPASAVVMPLKVGFVYVSPVGQAGWTYQHHLGRLAMEQALGPRVQVRAVEAVPEGADSERVLRDLAATGHRLIFATSFGYLEPALRVAQEFPLVHFEHAGGYKTAPNLKTYNARYYEARYLAGLLAGHASRAGVAGYVAGFPVPEVVQGINAFTLGMRAVNPRAEVRVLWLNAWFDPAREREAALALVNQGADLLTNHSGSPAVPQVAQERGVHLLAYQSDMAVFAPTAQLAAVTHHWGGYYTAQARAMLDGTWTPRPVWGGMKDGLVQLSALKPGLPAAALAQVRARQADIVAGRFQPFSGALPDQAGRPRGSAGRALTDEQIAAMDWFVQGVAGAARGG